MPLWKNEATRCVATAVQRQELDAATWRQWVNCANVNEWTRASLM